MNKNLFLQEVESLLKNAMLNNTLSIYRSDNKLQVKNNLLDGSLFEYVFLKNYVYIMQYLDDLSCLDLFYDGSKYISRLTYHGEILSEQFGACFFEILLNLDYELSGYKLFSSLEETLRRYYKRVLHLLLDEQGELDAYWLLNSKWCGDFEMPYNMLDFYPNLFRSLQNKEIQLAYDKDIDKFIMDFDMQHCGSYLLSLFNKNENILKANKSLKRRKG